MYDVHWELMWERAGKSLNIVLVLAGGTGCRLGAEIPKQYIEVKGRPIISYCLSLLAEHDRVEAIQIVADQRWRGFIQDKMSQEASYENYSKKFKGFSNPGENRQLSILQGLEDILAYGEDSDGVIVHDAVRPCVTKEMISACFDALEGHDAVVPVLPMKDTVYYSSDKKKISSLLNRSHIFAGQAPEAFRLQVYYKANRSLLPDRILEINGAMEPAVLVGMDVVMIPGDEENFKITTWADLARFREKV